MYGDLNFGGCFWGPIEQSSLWRAYLILVFCMLSKSSLELWTNISSDTYSCDWCDCFEIWITSRLIPIERVIEPTIRTIILSNVWQTRNLSLLVIGWKNTPYMKFGVFKWIPFVDHWEKPGIFWTVLRLFDFVKDLVATKWSGNTVVSELSPKLQKRSTNAVKIIRKLGLNDIDRFS